jgi:hypothetical protein
MPTTFRLSEAALFESRQQPWRNVPLPWGSGQPVSSMMVPDELAFLYYLTRVHYGGQGAIVDLGPLAGGSAYALAAGMNKSVFKVHSFDLWRAWPECKSYFPGLDLKTGDDLLPAFLQNTAPYNDRIVPYKGDILLQRWCGEPIEIIFIDAAKSPALMLHIIREFYLYLIPGAFIVHQDYVSSQCPWIHIAERELGEYFQVYDSPDGGSVCFRLRKRFTAHAILPGNYFNKLPLSRACQLLNEAVCLFPACWERLCVRLAWAEYLLRARRLAEAKAVYDDVIGDRFIECEGVRNDVKFLCSEIAAQLI